MKESPSHHAGIAALLVFGLGLLLVSFNLPPDHQEQALSLRWTGALVSVLGFLVMGLALSQSPPRKALFVAVAAIIYSGALAYHAAIHEITGTATYYHNILSKGDRGEPVSRETSPAKFRKATNLLWGGSGLFLGITVLSLAYYRRLVR
jgi:hypothetical protein